MERYPAPAQPLIAAMEAAAAAAPNRTIAFQGAPGANSHIALTQFDSDALPLPCYTFEDAIDAVREGRAGRAMIPIENSLHGRVADIHFILPESGLMIIGEHFLPIRHALIGLTPDAEVRAVLSHPQALGQCRKWLRERGIEPVTFADTAAAAARIAELGKPEFAALAPELAATLYHLPVLARGIADGPDNVTRFVVLARPGRRAPNTGAMMTSFLFEVRNVPAALYKALGAFATNGVNMTRLESYQRGASFAATEFFADIEGHPDDPPVIRALEELEFHARSFRLLGSYPRSNSRDSRS